MIIQLLVAGLMIGSILPVEGQEKITPSAFNTIRASRDVRVHLKKGEKNAVTIEQLGDIKRKNLRIQVKNGVLHIKTDLGLGNKEKAKVNIIYQQINAIEAVAGAEILSTDTIAQPLLDCTSNSGSVITIDVNSDSVFAKVSSGGLINMGGKTKNLRVVTNAGSTFNGFDLKSQKVDVKASTGSKAKVYALQSVEAEAKAGGFINIQGKPEEEHIQSKFGGEIIRKESGESIQ